MTPPRLGEQWHHPQLGSQRAWARTRGRVAGGKPIRIGLIDEGCDIRHPDLRDGIAGAAWGNASGLMIPWKPGDYFRRHRHGTACAGLAIARAGAGGLGLAYEATLVAFDASGWSTSYQKRLANAVDAAAGLTEHPELACDVICCSLGPDQGGFSALPELSAALARAANDGRGGLGCPIVWAVPNAGGKPGEVCTDGNVLAVGSVDRHGKRHGAVELADVFAPGEQVLTTMGSNGWGFVSGTSFAAPLVAALAAMVLAGHPSRPRASVIERILSTTTPRGVIDAAAATRP